MGLDVTLYTNIKLHQCPNKQTLETPVTYARKKDGTGHCIHSIDDAVDPTEWDIIKISKGCQCDEEDPDLIQVHVGYISVFPNKSMEPGNCITCDGSECIYFGNYSRWAWLCRTQPSLNIMRCMSDCDGMYTGRCLVDLHNQLGKYIQETEEPDPALQRYFDLLDSHRDILDDCLLKHH